MTTTLPLDLIAPFDSLLRDDPSADNLLIWADALEDAGDEACRGVREFLVGQKRRTELNENVPGYGFAYWWEWAEWYDVSPHWIPREIGARLCFYTDELEKSLFYEQHRLGPHYYTIALYDAAQAWCELYPPEKSSK